MVHERMLVLRPTELSCWRKHAVQRDTPTEILHTDGTISSRSTDLDVCITRIEGTAFCSTTHCKQDGQPSISTSRQYLDRRCVCTPVSAGQRQGCLSVAAAANVETLYAAEEPTLHAMHRGVIIVICNRRKGSAGVHVRRRGQ